MGDVVVSAAPIGFTTEQAKPGLIYVLTKKGSLVCCPLPTTTLPFSKVFLDEAQEIGDDDGD